MRIRAGHVSMGTPWLPSSCQNEFPFLGDSVTPFLLPKFVFVPRELHDSLPHSVGFMDSVDLVDCVDSVDFMDSVDSVGSDVKTATK